MMESASALFITITTTVVPTAAWVTIHMTLGVGPTPPQGSGQFSQPVGLLHHGLHEGSGIHRDGQCLHHPYTSQASCHKNLKIRSQIDFLEDIGRVS